MDFKAVLGVLAFWVGFGVKPLPSPLYLWENGLFSLFPRLFLASDRQNALKKFHFTPHLVFWPFSCIFVF